MGATFPPNAGDVLRLLRHEAPRADPGGPFTSERIEILRERAASTGDHASPFAYTPTHARALCDALDEIERLQAESGYWLCVVGLLTRFVQEMTHPLLVGVRGASSTTGDPVPPWLTRIIEDGRATSIQADRALVFADPPSSTCGWDGRRWYRHAVPPPQADPVLLRAARWVAATLRGH